MMIVPAGAEPPHAPLAGAGEIDFCGRNWWRECGSGSKIRTNPICPPTRRKKRASDKLTDRERIIHLNEGRLKFRDGDVVRAVMWLDYAAQKGHREAQYQLGDMYFNGRGVRCNEAKAVEWIRRAPNRGTFWASSSLAYSIMRGRVWSGITRMRRSGIESAEQRNAEAQYRLALCYGRGEGVKRSEC